MEIISFEEAKARIMECWRCKGNTRSLPGSITNGTMNM